MVAELGLEADATTKAPRAPSTAQITKMIRALVSRRLTQMTETPMADGEQEQKLLETIARTTAKLEDLDKLRKQATGKGPRRSTKAVMELRRRIADRIEQLNQG